MKKIFFFRYALLLSILLLSIISNGCTYIHTISDQVQDISSLQPESSENDSKGDSINSVNDIPRKYIDSSTDITPSLIHNDKALNVLGTTIFLGEDVEDIIDKLGKPNRIAKTEMDFDYYVYNNNYNKLLFVAIRNDKVIGYYTDSIDFNYLDIVPGCSLDKVNQSLGLNLSMDYILTCTTDIYTLHILMDKIDTHAVTGLSLLAADVKKDGYSDEAMKDVELLVYDLTNSIRKRNDIPILSWSSSAAKAARKHSIDMAENDFFDHYNLYNKDPGDRLKEEGISCQSIGENIIAGYKSAIISSHAWFNSPEHRDNILNKSYKTLGVGFTYKEDSTYKNYITQNFYR